MSLQKKVVWMKKTLRWWKASFNNTVANCDQNLVLNHVTDIKIYSLAGVEAGRKVTLRCKRCKLSYNYSQFGNKHDLGFKHYPEPRKYIEVSDQVYFDRDLHEFQCSLAYVTIASYASYAFLFFSTRNHSWVSFQGFCEAYNDTFQLTSGIMKIGYVCFIKQYCAGFRS